MQLSGALRSLGFGEAAQARPSRRDVAAGAAERRRTARAQPASSEAEAAAAEKKARRMARLLKNYEGQMESQNDEVELYTLQRSALELRQRFKSAGTGYKDQTRASKKESLFIYDPTTGKKEPNVGWYGEGKPHWWALWVQNGREKQVVDAIERLLPTLGPVIWNGEELEEPRSAECWIPQKRVRAFSVKAGKYGSRLLKYEDGGWVMVRTVLDRPFAGMLQFNLNVL